MDKSMAEAGVRPSAGGNKWVYTDDPECKIESKKFLNLTGV